MQEVKDFSIADLEKDKLVRTAIALSWFTIFYNIVEGIVSITLGISEGSVALAGFGGDSLIEVGSAALVLWRFRGETGRSAEISRDREKKASLGIGILFLILAAVTGISSIIQLISKSHPETTVPGIVVSALSLSFMFYLWKSKKRVGNALQSATILNDAACSYACIKLSAVLFFGSLLFTVFPSLWWLDATAALVLTIFIIREGWEILEASRKPEFSGGCGCAH